MKCLRNCFVPDLTKTIIFKRTKSQKLYLVVFQFVRVEQKYCYCMYLDTRNLSQNYHFRNFRRL
jgi:hypothetical protein